ncbi:PcfJ domain-containing protein [Flavobacterium branchiicola]|uniref:PcfJ domain-containing protein n=1 Tax=Flavobacterium branchiicola TaxID=1114875 RepID=A0ABV9PA97_9FLAO|nr:PcfJ domain-containing protein [Flavobacterium branchiicola]MBS7253344.1 PcfJ domain-containing protein [Flavobacterium branchiicola]
MIPKTIIEKQITSLSETLLPVSQKMQVWAEKNIFIKWGVLSRGKFHCLDCSHSWKPDAQKASCQKYINCTACSGKLKMQQYNQVHFKEIEYFAVLDVCGGFQVVRIICSHKDMKKNCMPTYFHKEVMQHWINEKGEVRTLSLGTNVFSNAYDAWKYYTSLEIRPKSFEDSPKYRINPYKVYSSSKAVSILKRNGFKGSFYGIAPQVLFTALLKDSYAETLFKTGQTDFLKHYLLSRAQCIRENWQAVKTCFKNNYKVSDFTLWEDYISLLRWFKKDLSIPQNVCPENLAEQHDRLVERKRRIQRRLKIKELRSEIQQAQMIYEEQKKQFFGLEFTRENLSISVMESVQDFLEEGDMLRHCLFTNEYYKKKNSLILSARYKDNPVETIEVALPSLEIVQCRGNKNKESPHHKQILKLLNQNLYQIKKRIKNKKAIRAEN